MAKLQKKESPRVAMKREQYLCEEDVVLGRVTVDDYWSIGKDKEQSTDGTVSWVKSQIQKYLRENRDVRCGGRCIEDDSQECVLKVSPAISPRLSYKREGFIVNGEYGETWRCYFKKTRFKFTCECIDTIGIA